MAERGGWAGYRRDLAAALRAWRHEPIVPVISAGLAVATLVPDRWLWVALPVLLFSVGWPGTERMFYLRAFRGLPLLTSERWRFTWAFFGRFAALGLVVSVPVMGVLWLLLVARTPGLVFGAITGIGLILDVLLTFVTPALAFSTGRVSVAWHLGHRTLVDHWPASAWYALVPPMATLVTFRMLPRSVIGLAGQAGLVGLAALLNLWFKSAAAAFYLRHHQVGDDGAVDAPRLETLDRFRERFGPEEG